MNHISLKHISIHNNNLKTLLFLNKQQIGHSTLHIHKNVPIITDIHIDNPYRKNGYGSFLLNSIENRIKGDRLYINTWYLDRCYFNYLSFYKKRGYNLCVFNEDRHIDDGENIYYNLYAYKNVGSFE